MGNLYSDRLLIWKVWDWHELQVLETIIFVFMYGSSSYM